jgi:hypothetical protein
MSLYKQCSEAASNLMANPPEEFGGVFSEIDVVNAAASRGWSGDNYKEALRHANQVLGTLYRSRKLARYGPVTLPNGNLDYGRIASKIVYAAAETGPEKWKTPNGTFARLMIEDDDFGRQGRRYGTNRNDLAPWDAQDIHSQGTEKDHAHEPDEAERKIVQLKRDLDAAHKQIRELQAENARLREHKAVPANGNSLDEPRVKQIVEDAVFSVIGDLDERITQIEGRQSAIKAAFDPN